MQRRKQRLAEQEKLRAEASNRLCLGRIPAQGQVDPRPAPVGQSTGGPGWLPPPSSRDEAGPHYSRNGQEESIAEWGRLGAADQRPAGEDLQPGGAKDPRGPSGGLASIGVPCWTCIAPAAPGRCSLRARGEGLRARTCDVSQALWDPGAPAELAQEGEPAFLSRPVSSSTASQEAGAERRVRRKLQGGDGGVQSRTSARLR